jgi:hypothetical protein
VVKTYLLDVNVALALGWAGHAHHRPVVEWFRAEGQHSFALCTITEAGFVRLLSSATITGEVVPMGEAREILAGLAELPGYHFWPLERTFLEMTAPFEGRLHGYRQVSDAVLLGLAVERQGSVATLDSALRHLAGPGFAEHVTLVREVTAG